MSTTYYYMGTSNMLVALASVLNPNAASGANQVALTWDFQYAKYEITRSSSANGAHAVIASNVNAIRYEDKSASSGTAN